jgi:tetratricopeptide (TPR) repeat protein
VSANWHPNDGEYKEEAGSGWFPSGKVRLFPNDARIRFEKPVHEVVEDSLLMAGYEIVKSDIPIHHYGKLDTEEIRAKGEEYFQLGKKKLAEQGAEDPKALYELAVQASELEKHDEALEFWQRLVAVKPDFGKAYYGMGTSYYRLGRYGEACSAYRKAVEITPGSKDPVVMYATSELIAGDADAAVSLLDGLLQKEPGYPLALLAAAAAYFCAGRKKEGLAYARKVQETQFGLAPYLTDIAKILISVKRFDYARALLDAAAETGDLTDEIRKLTEEIQKKQKGSRIQGFEDSTGIQQDSRIQGDKDSSDSQGKKLSTPGPLESSAPVSSVGTLSLCMIVKDEEETIARALMSVKPVVAEMIVVDTGSTDRTKKIAAELGAKVFDFQWTDNFSDARNFSLSKATGDWILVLDADEVISARDHEKLRQLVALKKGILTAYSFVTRTYVEQMNTIGWTANDGYYKNEETGTGWFPGEKVRLFPNDGRIRFDFTLHERIEPSLIKAGMEIRKCDVPVHHYGNFVKKDKIASKAKLYYELGKRKIAEEGEKNFMAYYELAIQGAELGKHEETLEYLKKVTALRPDFPKAYQSIGNTYYNLGEYDKALPFYKKALELDPAAKDTVLMYATCEIFAGNAEKAISLIEEFLGGDLASPHTLVLLAEAYFCAGRKEQGMEYVKKLRKLKLDAGSIFNNFAKLLISTSRRDYALSILDAAVEAGVATDETEELIGKISPLK